MPSNCPNKERRTNSRSLCVTYAQYSEETLKSQVENEIDLGVYFLFFVAMDGIFGVNVPDVLTHLKQEHT